VHELAYPRAEVPPAPPDDPRATQTTVLSGSDLEQDEDDEERDDEQDDEAYSSIARGS
jgi:hypothetical protein